MILHKLYIGFYENATSSLPINFLQAPVVLKVDKAIHLINLYPLDSAIHDFLILIHWIVIYAVDSAIHRLNNSCRALSFKTSLLAICSVRALKRQIEI